jgi:hypothetical protein
MKISPVKAHLIRWALFDLFVSMQDDSPGQPMNRLLLAAGFALLSCGTSAFAQSSSDFPDVPNNSAVTNATVAQNFQYMNHPAPPVPASSTPGTQGGRGHGRRQSMSSNPTGSDSSQP